MTALKEKDDRYQFSAFTSSLPYAYQWSSGVVPNSISGRHYSIARYMVVQHPEPNAVIAQSVYIQVAEVLAVLTVMRIDWLIQTFS
ncbi:MAG: hypothetical protein EOP49_00790 [Sphingobacteriales bacterium]|nr:MAG: hypothetical protein EOP49_00790 [Sphingobacteriales bacterium]